ncbi:MAG: PEGA domain-containing protein [Candidatus Acidiferrales bacterium]
MTIRDARFSKAVRSLVFAMLALPVTSYAQNQVLGEMQLVGKSKVEKNSGVWIDGQYVGYVAELKDDKKVLLLPGEHEISVRQSGYTDFAEKVIVEPGKKVVLHVTMQKDPQAQYSTVTSEIKLKVTPERAAVFLDDVFAGTVHEFSGVGRAMLVSPGKHRVKIALPGYQDFETEVSLLPRQKVTLKTDLAVGSITQAGPSIKKD